MFLVPKIGLTVSIALLTIAFISGWLYINKLGIDSYNPADEQETITKKSVDNFKQFFVGIGENFFKTLFSFIVIALFYFSVMYGVIFLCFKFFGEPTLIMNLPELAKTQTGAELMTYLNNISIEDKLNFISWVWTAIIVSSVLNYFSLLCLVTLFMEKKNIFVSLWKAIVFFVKNIFAGLLIVLVMFFFYFLLNLLSFISGSNSFSFAVLIILFTLYLNYYVILVFCFYNERTKNNSNNRTE